MQKYNLIDHTNLFSKNIDDTEIDFDQKYMVGGQRTIDRIDKILELIDKKIIELSNIVDENMRFSTENTENFVERFKECSNSINIVSGQVVKIIKTYENSDPFVYKHYLLLIKEKMTSVENINSKFKNSQFISNLSNGFFDHQLDDGRSNIKDNSLLLQKNDDDIELQKFINKREEAVNQLASSIADLHQQFIDVHLLTLAQGETLNIIDSNIIKSLDYVKEGKTELKQADIYHEKTNKTKRGVTMAVVASGTLAVIVTGLIKKFI